MCINIKVLKFITLPILLLCCEDSNAQALKAGDQLPVKSLNEIYNFTSKVLNLEDFKGKAIIFDFWAPNCKSCLESFIKLDSLQHQFGDKIQIVLVNKQSRDSTINFFALRPFLHRPNLPFVTNDTLLHSFFPTGVVPAIAWVDRNNVFHKMTSRIDVADVTTFFKENVVRANSYIKQYTYLNTLFNTNFEDSVTYHSYLSKQIYGVNLKPTINGSNGIVATNTKLWSLYLNAYEENGKYNLKGPQQVIFPQSEIDKKNLSILYNYSLKLPIAKKTDLYQTMQADLKRNFNYIVSVEMRKAVALVLVSKDSKNSIATKGGKQMQNFATNDKFSTNRTTERILNNYPMEKFSDRIGNWVMHKFKMPYVNEVAYKGNVDIVFDGEIMDSLTIAGLKSELNRYGLDLVEKEIMQWTLVFK